MYIIIIFYVLQVAHILYRILFWTEIQITFGSTIETFLIWVNLLSAK